VNVTRDHRGVNAATPIGNTTTTGGNAPSPAGSAAASNRLASVKVNVVRAPTAQSGGVVSVVVPKGTAGTDAGLAIPIPAQVISASTAAKQTIKITLANNAPAPSWIKFSPETKSFAATSVPAKSLPIQLALTVGNYRTLIQLSESK
jgi:hypothetical protein